MKKLYSLLIALLCSATMAFAYETEIDSIYSDVSVSTLGELKAHEGELVLYKGLEPVAVTVGEGWWSYTEYFMSDSVTVLNYSGYVVPAKMDVYGTYYNDSVSTFVVSKVDVIYAFNNMNDLANFVENEATDEQKMASYEIKETALVTLAGPMSFYIQYEDIWGGASWKGLAAQTGRMTMLQFMPKAGDEITLKGSYNAAIYDEETGNMLQLAYFAVENATLVSENNKLNYNPFDLANGLEYASEYYASLVHLSKGGKIVEDDMGIYYEFDFTTWVETETGYEEVSGKDSLALMVTCPVDLEQYIGKKLGIFLAGVLDYDAYSQVPILYVTELELMSPEYVLNAYANYDDCYVDIQYNIEDNSNQAIIYAYSSNEYYSFKQWSDGNTDNPRTVTLTSDTTFVAEFARSYYINAYSNNESWGTVTGGGTYLEGDTVTLIAKANEGFQLYYWVFGNTYPFEVTNDTLRLIVNGNDDIAAWFRYSPVVIDGINYYLDREYNYAYVLYLENYTGDIVIPSSVVYKDKTYGVGGIYEDAFAGTSITSLTVSNGLNGIDLSGCDSLVALSGNIGFIGACRGLNSLKGLKEIYVTSGTLATGNVRNFNFLNLLQIPTLEVLDLSKVENTELSPEMFKETYLEDVYYYGYYVDRVYLSLKNLRKLVLPEGLTKIHERQFESLWMLEEIVIPDGVTDIPDGAFYDCHALANIEFSKNLTSIGKYAFYSCHALENIVIPEGVTEIGDAAFYGCNYADEIVIASSVKRIGNNAFALCNQVERMEVCATIPPSIKAKTFYQVNRNIEFVVPVEARNAYAEDIYWREFIQKAPTDIDATNTDSFVVYTQGGMLYIEGVETDYNVFDSAGRLIYTGRDAQLQLPRGVYMIAIGDKIQKVVL